jgi:chromosome partitioning protein
MRGQVILIGGEKGGVGKSTITTNVAVQFSKMGAEVIIIDADPQKTSVNWSDRRNQKSENYKKISCVSKEGDIKQTVKDFASKYDIVLIDVGGKDSLSLRSGLGIADKFFCPARASQADLETLEHIYKLVLEAKCFNEFLVSRTLISCAPTNPVINEVNDAKDFLSSYIDDLSLCQTFISDRKVYRDALIEGLGVIEFDNLKAKEEIENFVNEINKIG